MAKHMEPMEDFVEVYTPYITVKGKRIYPKNAKVFKLRIPKSKYKPRRKN